MKNYYRLLLCSALTLSSFIIKAQDVIYLANGKEMQVKVMEITPEKDIKYKRFDNQDGPMYTAKFSEVKKLVYKNGKEEEGFGQGATDDAAKKETGGSTGSSGEKKFDVNDSETQKMIEVIAKNAGDKVLHRCASKVDNSTVDVFFDQVFKDQFSGEINIPIIVKWDKGLANKDRWIKGTVKVTKEGKKTWSFTDDSGIWFSGCAKSITDLE